LPETFKAMKDKFLDRTKDIPFTPEEMRLVAPIIELARESDPWSAETIKKLCQLYDAAFPGVGSYEERMKTKEEEMNKRRSQ
jgi:hypothetical protein